MIRLPSGRLLSYYKNSVSQEAMFNEDVLKLMLQEARKRMLGTDGMMGGIVLDEMSIQVNQVVICFVLLYLSIP